MNTSKILYIDDEEMNLKLFDIHFGEKYGVITTNTGSEGMQFLDENPDISIIISDLKMPGMSGIEFVKKAKLKHPNKNYYILTGFEITTEIISAIESGLIKKYFSKPFNFRDIERIFENS